MSAPTLTPPRKRPATIILFRVLLIVLLLAALAGAGAFVWFRSTATAALPQLDGTIQLAGVTAPVTIARDAQGVPHITAASLEDLLFAQGFVTAQDRLWQMDVGRRFGRGELSEIFGGRTLKLDRQQRYLQLVPAVERAIAILTPAERRLLDAYARGVNALMERQRGRLPIEFKILGYEPRPWTPADSLMIGVNIAQSLSTSYTVEYAREKVSTRLGPELAADLYPTTSWRDRPPGSVPNPLPPASPAPRAESRDSDMPALITASAEDPCDSCYPGSNNWVISGAHTSTGKPLLSNDMHLQHSIPNTWYEVHLRAGELDVAGFSFPGLPFVIAGHNQRIAWGFTNLGPDVQDLFIETFNAQGQYQTPAGWQAPAHRAETIHVKGASDVVLDVVTTRHGPIVTELFPGETRKLALQWTIYDPETLRFHLLDLDRAQDWTQFRAAIAHFAGATQNVVFADVEGHIGYQAAGWIPVRASGDGAVPVDGSDGRHDWTGYVPFDKLPSLFDPASGIIATANARVTPSDYPFLLANQWGAPFRTARIYEVLESGKRFRPADMLTLQMDTDSEYDRLCAQAFRSAIEHAPAPSPRARQAADLLRRWDGRVEVASVAPTLTVSARRQLWKLLLSPRLGAQWEDYQWFSSSVALETMLRERPRRWLPAGYADWDALLLAAVEAAIADPAAPKDLSRWTWGGYSPLFLQHPVLGGIWGLNQLAGPGLVPQSGNGSLTVKAAGRSFGASERATYDLADLDASMSNIVTGQSGQVFSPHYMDQWPAWYEGHQFPLAFSAGAVDKAAVHTLRLAPQ